MKLHYMTLTQLADRLLEVINEMKDCDPMRPVLMPPVHPVLDPVTDTLPEMAGAVRQMNSYRVAEWLVSVAEWKAEIRRRDWLCEVSIDGMSETLRDKGCVQPNTGDFVS